MASQARGLQNFISDLRNAKSKVRLSIVTLISTLLTYIHLHSFSFMFKLDCSHVIDDSFSFFCNFLFLGTKFGILKNNDNVEHFLRFNIQYSTIHHSIYKPIDEPIKKNNYLINYFKNDNDNTAHTIT